MEEPNESVVMAWQDRPRRTRRPPPKTYWEEFVETDDWYLKKLLEDVPEDELDAALHDEDFEHDETGEEGDESEGEEEEGEESEDLEYVPEEVDSESFATSDYSDMEVEDAASEDPSEDASSTDGDEEEEVQRSPERE